MNFDNIIMFSLNSGNTVAQTAWLLSTEEWRVIEAQQSTQFVINNTIDFDCLTLDIIKKVLAEMKVEHAARTLHTTVDQLVTLLLKLVS